MKFLEELLGELEGKEEIIKTIKSKVAEGYVIKTDFNSKIDELSQVKEELQERDAQLQELKEEVKGNEELTKQIEELEETNKKNKEEYEDKIASINKNNMIEKSISQSELNVIDAEIVKSLVDMDSIIINDDGITGLKEQLESIKEKKPFLFEEEVEEEIEIEGFTPPEGKLGGDNKAMTYEEMMANLK